MLSEHTQDYDTCPTCQDSLRFARMVNLLMRGPLLVEGTLKQTTPQYRTKPDPTAGNWASEFYHYV